MRRRQYERARTALEQSIRTHPSYATAYENLGDVYAKLASQAYDKALQLDSSNTGAQKSFRWCATGSGPAPATAVAAANRRSWSRQKPAAEKPPARKPPRKRREASRREAGREARAQDSAEVLKALNEWAQAWSKKDADGYLSFYAKDFKTPGGEARDAWEKSRRARIAAPKSSPWRSLRPR